MSWGCGDDGAGQDCPVGGRDCPCTDGNGCDPGLTCVGEVCIVVDGPTPTSGPGSTGASQSDSNSSPTSDSDSDSATSTDSTSTSGGTATSGATDGGPKLDVGSRDTEVGPTSGCQAIDVLFVLDGSGSMAEERNALAAQGAFTQIIQTLEGLNGGGIDYRIGVTDDDDHGFMVPPGWAEPDPWFDSDAMDETEIAAAFNGAVGQVGGLGGASVGCEHVLTSGVDLLDGDVSMFVREEALLVMVLLTDVDDYGAYDQVDGNDCGLGCTTTPTPVDTLRTRLIDDVKGGETEGVAAIVIAGDPSSNAGLNFCGQPGSCGCDGLDCEIFHADRLQAFADSLDQNGVFADLCISNVPGAIETALTDSIEIACMNFEPEG